MNKIVSCARLALLVGGLGFAAALAGTTAAVAAFPEKPITIIQPWGAGSASDIVMRILAEEAESVLGQPVVVQTIAGGGGTKAALATKAAAADGYTLSNTWVANQVLATVFNPDVGYTTYDFDPIGLVWVNPFTLVVSSDHPSQTLPEFVEWAKEQGTLRVGVCAAVGLPRVVMERFLEIAGIENAKSVPYDDCETANIKGLFDGSLHFSTGALSVENIYGDAVRSLTIFTDERSPIADHIPAMTEYGFDTEWGAASAGWSGLVLPKGVPEERAEFLRTAFAQVLQSEIFLTKMKEGGFTPKYLGPDDFQALWGTSHAKLGPAMLKLKNK